MQIPEIPRRQPQWLVLSEALALVALIGWFDHATGWEWSFFAPFALPIILVTWKAGQRLGFGCAALCAITFGAAHIGSHPYQTGWGFALSVLGRWFYFSVLVVAVNAVASNRRLNQGKIEMLERAGTLEKAILLTSEREQQRIGRDLHDSLGPHLAAIKYAATFLVDDLRGRDEAAAAKAEQIRGMAGDAVSLTRDLARGIFPVLLDDSGLSIALDELAHAVSSQSGMAASFHETSDTQVGNPDHAMHLYRIAQEAVSNAAKHGGASKVTIILSQADDALRLTVADDGKGMFPAASETRGMGLHSMRYRAQVLGGELRIDSRPNEGTIVSCEIPNRLGLPAKPAP